MARVPHSKIRARLSDRLMRSTSFVHLGGLSLDCAFPRSLLGGAGIVRHTGMFKRTRGLLAFAGFANLSPRSGLGVCQTSCPLSHRFSFNVRIAFWWMRRGM